jgi:hypothetical protein
MGMPNPSEWPAATAYFRDYAEGRFDEAGQLQYIYPVEAARLSDDGQALFIGRPGTDGMEFGYRMGAPGIWVWYPIEQEWRKVAEDVHVLDRDWLSGALKV